MANGGTITFGVKYNVDQSGLNNIKKNLQEMQRMTTAAFSNVNKTGFTNAGQELQKVKHTAQEVENALERAFNPNLNTYNLTQLNKELNKIGIDKIYNDFQKMGTAGQSAFRGLVTQIATTNQQLKQSHKLIDDFANTMSNTIKWGITSSIMNTFTGTVEKAYGYVKNLDSSLNDIRIVTGQSAEEMDKFAVKANNAAKALGSSTLDYTKAALIYYQQGLNDLDVQARADVTIKAANVTGQSGDAVSEQLTAVWNGYKVSAEEAELYIDKLAAVAASTAADLEELSTGMSKVASAANAMGVDVDQLNAQLATIVSVTRQAPESVGTALKTIYARMSDLKIGKTDEDGLGLGDVSGTMESMGISILDETGNLRDMGKIIEDVAAKWDTWTEAQQAAMAQVMAGKRQYNNLVALFENWDMYTESLKTSQTAAGTLAEQNEIYLDSVEAHLNQLSTAAEDLYDSLFNADSFKDLIDLGTGAITVFGDFIDIIGGGGTALTALGGIATRVFSKNIAEGLQTTIANLRVSNSEIENARLQIQMLQQTMAEMNRNGKNDAVVEEVVNQKMSLNQYSPLMTPETQAQGNALLQDYSQALDQQDIFMQNKKAAEEYLQTIRSLGDGLIDLANPEVDQQQETFRYAIEDAEKAMSNLIQKIQQYDKASKEKLNTKSLSSSVKAMNKAFTEYSSTIKISKDDTQRFNAALSKFQKAAKEKDIAKQKEAYKELNIVVKEITNSYNKGIEVAKDFVEMGGSGVSNAMHQQANTVEAAKQKLDDFKQKLSEIANIQSFVQLLGTIGQLSSAIQSMQALPDIWGNNDLSDGEKILQTITSLSFALPMLLNGASSLSSAWSKINTAMKLGKEAFEAEAQAAALSTASNEVNKQKTEENTRAKIENANAEKIDAVETDANTQQEAEQTVGTIANTNAEKANTAAKIAGTAASKGAAVGLKALTAGAKAFFASMGPIGWVTLAISALIPIISGLADAYETAEEKAQKAAEAAQDWKNTLNDAENSYQDLISTVEQYDQAKKGLDSLRKGTEDWKEQIDLANDSARDLIAKWSELAKYATVDENGIITIDPEKLEEFQEQEREKLNKTAVISAIADIEAKQAKVPENPTLAFDSDIELNRIISEAYDKFLNTGNEESRNFMSDIGGYNFIYTINENLSNIDFSAEETVQNWLRQNTEGFAKLDEVTKDVIEKEFFQPLATYLYNAGKEFVLYRQTEEQAEDQISTSASNLSIQKDFTHLEGVSSEQEKLLLEKALKDATADDIKISQIYQDAIKNKTISELKEEYAALKGLEYTGGKLYKQDGSEDTADIEKIKEVIGSLAIYESTIEKNLPKLQEIFTSNYSDNLKDVLSSYILNGEDLINIDLSRLNLKELDQFEDTIGAKPSTLGRSYVPHPLYNKIEEAKDSLQKFAETYDDTFLTDFFGDNFITENILPESTYKQIEDNLQKAFLLGGEKGKEGLKTLLENSTDEQKIDFLNLINAADFTSNIKVQELQDNIKQLGIEINFSSDAWKNFTASAKTSQLNYANLNSVLVQTQDALSDIDTIASDLKIGSVISGEDFNRLQQLTNKDLSQYFGKETTLDAEGKETVTYTFKANFVPTEDSQTFADYLKTDIINVEDIKNAYEEQSKLAQLIIYRGFKDFDDVNSQLNQVFSNQSLVDYLSGVTGQELTKDMFSDLTDPTQLANWQFIWEHVLQLISNFENGLLDATASEETFVKYFVKDYNQLIKAYSQGQISYQTYHKERMAFIQDELEALDITQEQFNSYLEQLQRKYPNMSDVQVEQFAIQTYKLNQGIKELITNWDSWNKVLSDSSEISPEYNEALKAMNSSTAKLLGLSDANELTGSQGEQFLENEENRQLIYDITVKGDYEKIVELRQKYAEWKVEVSVELQDSKIQEQLPIAIDKISSEFNELNIGDSLSQSLQDEIKTMISDAGDGALEIIEILSGLGASISGTQLLLKTLSWTSEDWTNAISSPGAYGLGDYKEELYALGTYSSLTDEEIGQQLTNRWISNLTITKGPGADEKAVQESIDKEEIEETRTSGTGKDKWEKDTNLKDTEKKAKVEYDRYHDVNIEIQKQVDLLNKLQNEEDELVGQAYLDNLEQQNVALEKQNEWIEKKIELKKEEAAELRKSLELEGMEFDEEGDISNYLSKMKGLVEEIDAAQAKVNEANKAYNEAASEEAENTAKDRIDFAQRELDKLLEQYEWLKELIEKYEQIQYDDLPQLESEQEANIDKQIENEIKSLNYAIDVDLDLADAERQWNEFKWKVLEKGTRFSLFGDDILGEAEMLMQNLQTYPESISGLMNQVQKYMDIINGGGQFSAGTDMAAAIENAEKYRDELMATMESVEDAIQQIQQLYLNMIDAAKDAFDDHIAQYELVNEILEHNINLIEKLDGEDSFDAMDRYYEEMEQNNNANLAFQKQQVEFWKQRMEAEEYGSEAWLKYKENWQNAMSELNSTVESSIDNLIAKYQNAVSSIMANLTASLTGNNLGLDFLEEEWNLINENADAYLDKINSMFAIDELQNKYMDAINNTDNIDVQERLTKVMNEQVAALEAKGKLTEYDVKRANLLYEIELKKIALEEAQQNKSKMRLRRDSQGNYSYQFTADEDAIAKTQNELDQLQNSLYNLDREAYRNNLNEVYDVYAEFQERLKELYADQTLSDEEREAQREMLVQQYGERINGLVTENEVIRTNLYDSTFQELAKMYDTDIEHFRNMSQAEQDLLMQEMIPQWDTGIQTMIDKFSAEGGFGPVVAGTLSSLQEEHGKYEQDLQEMADAAGINLDAIRGGYDTVHESIERLIEQSEGELMSTWDDQLDKMAAIVDSLEAYDAALDSTRDAVGRLIEELNELIAKQKEANGGSSSSSGGDKKNTNTPTNKTPTGGGDKGDNNPSGDDGKNNNKSNSGQAKKVTLVKGDNDFYDTAYDSDPEPRQEQWKESKTVWVGWNKNAQSWTVNGRAAIYASESAAKNHITNPSGIAWVDKTKLLGLDTGGYTGMWGKEGKMAMLHEKELVLNKVDTENILAAVDIVRTISGVIDNLERSVSARMFDLNSFNIPQYAPPTQEAQSIEQQVHIDATFPNVQNSNEIEEAFNNLVNRATQHAFKTKR